MRRSAGTDSGWYDDRALFVIHSVYAQDSRGRATCTPLRNRIQAIKIMQLIAAVVGASAWEARQRNLTTASSSIMAGLLRITNHGFSSDSDAAFRRDRLRMVLRPRITGHKFRLYPGFRRARPLQRSVSASVLPFLTVMTGRAEKARASPYKSHTGDGDECVHGLQKTRPYYYLRNIFLAIHGEIAYNRAVLFYNINAKEEDKERKI